MTLLRRYGVMFWRLLEREAAWMPSWRELLPVYHRLEASGEIRGGRFVAGFSGEQFALPEAIPAAARSAAAAAGWQSLVCISGVDPLNLCGTLLPGDKVPALGANRILFRDGVPVATVVAGKIAYLVDPGADRELLHARLVGRAKGLEFEYCCLLPARSLATAHRAVTVPGGARAAVEHHLGWPGIRAAGPVLSVERKAPGR
jgi:ATP-dependent Lhr-like helicase